MANILPAPITAPPPGLDRATFERASAQARELEGVFLNTLMSQMFSSIDARGAFGGGYAEETWRSMQAEQMATSLGESGGIGLADDILRELLSMQQAATPSPAPASPLSRPTNGYRP